MLLIPRKMNRKLPPMPPARKESLSTVCNSPSKKTASSLENSSAESSPRHTMTTSPSSAFDTPPCSPFISSPTARVLTSCRIPPAPPQRSPTTRLSASFNDVEVVRRSSEDSGAECNASTAAARDVQVSAPKNDEKSVQAAVRESNSTSKTLTSPPSRPMSSPTPKPKSKHENVDVKSPSQDTKTTQLQQHQSSKPKGNVRPQRPPQPSRSNEFSSLPSHYRNKKPSEVLKSHRTVDRADPTVIVSRHDDRVATKQLPEKKKAATPPVKPRRKPTRQHSLSLNRHGGTVEMCNQVLTSRSTNDIQATIKESEQVAEVGTRKERRTIASIKADLKVRKHQSMKVDASSIFLQRNRMISDSELSLDARYVPSRPPAPVAAKYKQETHSSTQERTPLPSASLNHFEKTLSQSHITSTKADLSVNGSSVKKSPKLPRSSTSKQTSTSESNKSPHIPRKPSGDEVNPSKPTTDKLPSSQTQDCNPVRPPRTKLLALNHILTKKKSAMKPSGPTHTTTPHQKTATVTKCMESAPNQPRPADNSEKQVCSKVKYRRGEKPNRPAPPPPGPGALIRPYAEFSFDHVDGLVTVAAAPVPCKSKKERSSMDSDGDNEYIHVNSGVSVHKLSWPPVATTNITNSDVINHTEEPSVYTPLTVTSMNDNGLYCEVDYPSPSKKQGCNSHGAAVEQPEDNFYIEMRTPYEEIDFSDEDESFGNVFSPQTDDHHHHRHMDDKTAPVSVGKKSTLKSGVTQKAKELKSTPAVPNGRKNCSDDEDSDDPYCYIYLDTLNLRLHPLPLDQSSSKTTTAHTTHIPSPPAVNSHTTNSHITKQNGAVSGDKPRHVVSNVKEQDSTPPPSAPDNNNTTNNNHLNKPKLPRVSYENTILPSEKSRHKSVDSCSKSESSTKTHKSHKLPGAVVKENGLSQKGPEGDHQKHQPLRCSYVNYTVLPDPPQPVAASRH